LDSSDDESFAVTGGPNGQTCTKTWHSMCGDRHNLSI